jgi:2-acylglycerol O-acyltransferase 2
MSFFSNVTHVVSVRNAGYPHGVFPLSQMIGTSLTNSAWPGHKTYSVAASAVFKIPLWRHVMTWIGSRPATRKMFKSLLKHGSVGVVPGG